MEGLWTKIEEHLEIDPPKAVDRILGRKHVYDHSEGKATIFYDMVEKEDKAGEVVVEWKRNALIYSRSINCEIADGHGLWT